MRITINAISTCTDIPPCISIHEIKDAMQNDAFIQQLKECIVGDRPSYRKEIPQDIKLYGTFRDLAMIDRVVVKGKRIIIPAE